VLLYCALGIYVNTCRSTSTSLTLDFLRSQIRRNLGASDMLAVSAGNRDRRQVGCGLHVRANGRREAAAKVLGQPHFVLSAVRRIPGDGDASRGRAEYGGLADDPRSCEHGAIAEPGCVGKSAWSYRALGRGKGRTRVIREIQPRGLRACLIDRTDRMTRNRRDCTSMFAPCSAEISRGSRFASCQNNPSVI
jgi:hypothetical protein